MSGYMGETESRSQSKERLPRPGKGARKVGRIKNVSVTAKSSQLPMIEPPSGAIDQPVGEKPKRKRTRKRMKRRPFSSGRGPRVTFINNID